MKEIMYFPEEEYVSEEAAMGEAIHRLISRKYHSLIVARDDRIVGILRLSDAFELLSQKLERVFVE